MVGSGEGRGLNRVEVKNVSTPNGGGGFTHQGLARTMCDIACGEVIYSVGVV